MGFSNQPVTNCLFLARSPSLAYSLITVRLKYNYAMLSLLALKCGGCELMVITLKFGVRYWWALVECGVADI